MLELMIGLVVTITVGYFIVKATSQQVCCLPPVFYYCF
ncbi:anaerobic C4-dicarboxylate transporter DcuC [Vibrio maritimus]|uniref:Anaerobic C4-dicarboxylate transporter DcuC n=1 Tax=Vibrio maritimus TaxID=990268 RepID=A0A090U0W8_9VIBR|nr:anaerobic C4-dicarboxylate transporter DcuC [Vibrio maritimus]